MWELFWKINTILFGLLTLLAYYFTNNWVLIGRLLFASIYVYFIYLINYTFNHHFKNK